MLGLIQKVDEEQKEIFGEIGEYRSNLSNFFFQSSGGYRIGK